MAWIESHTVLIRHRKIVELARELRLRKSYVMGHLHALWHAAMEQAEDGDLSQWSDELIAELSDYPGNAPQYVQLLQKHGFLDQKVIHDWLKYAGRYLEAKYRTAKPARLKEIYAKHANDNLKTDFSPTKDTPPNQTLPNQTKDKPRPKVAEHAQDSIKGKKSLLDSPNPSHRCLGHFGARFKKKVGAEYPAVFAKEIKLFSEILASQSEPVVLDLIDIFFEKADNLSEWHSDKLTVGVFKSKVPELLIALSREAKKNAN